MSAPLQSNWYRRSVFVIAALFIPAVGSAQLSVEAPAAAELSPQEKQAWRALADRRFVSGDEKSALAAWNQIGEPVVDTVKVDGLERTSPAVVSNYLGLRSGELFTAERLSRLERRLDELPVASHAEIHYKRVANRAAVTLAIDERDAFPSGLTDWALVAARAAFQRDIQVELSDLAGWGEVWTPSFRFDPDSLRGLLRLAVPAPGRLPGVLQVEALAERQTYMGSSLDGRYQEQRFRAGLAMSDWVTSWLRVEAGPALDYIAGTRYLALEGDVRVRTLGDRLAVMLNGGHWTASPARSSFSTASLVATIRSTTRSDVPIWTMLAGVVRETTQAPLAVWPEASSGQGRGFLLRGHEFDREKLSGDEMLGRRLWLGSLEYEHRIANRFRPIGVVAFIDSAQALSRVDRTSSRVQMDIGAGLRVAVSKSGSRVRLDFGYGLRDGQKQMSAGYVLPWGTR